MRLLEAATGRPNLLWVAVPDVVGDAESTNRSWWQWVHQIKAMSLPVAYVCQDGCDAYELPDADCYFIGGTTRFKLSQDATDCVLAAKAMGKASQMGRVNTLTRIEAAMSMGVDTIDGTTFSRYGDTYLKKYADFIRLRLSGPGLFPATTTA